MSDTFQIFDKMGYLGIILMSGYKIEQFLVICFTLTAIYLHVLYLHPISPIYIYVLYQEREGKNERDREIEQKKGRAREKKRIDPIGSMGISSSRVFSYESS